MRKHIPGLDPPKMIDGTLIAFDFGFKRIGIAVGQTITYTATPIGIISAKDGIPAWPDIEKHLNQWQPNAVVVGIPVNVGYEDRQLEYAAIKFARRLKHRFQLPVFGMDEHLTTFAAKQLYSTAGKKPSKNTRIDDIAAKVILETWFKTHYAKPHAQRDNDKDEYR